MNASDFNDLILRIYSTVTTPEAWDDVLMHVAEAVGAIEANVFQGDAVQQELESVWLSDGLKGIFDEPSYAPALAEEARVYSVIQSLAPESRLFASRELQADYHKRGYPPVDMSLIEAILDRDYGIRSRFTAPLNRQPHHYEFFTLHYAENYDDHRFPTAGVNVGNMLIPHLAKAMAINRPFVMLQRRFNAILEVLDRFRLGVFILGEDRSVWLRNEAASQIVDAGDIFVLRPNGLLSGATSQVHTSLTKAIARLGNSVNDAVRSVRLSLGDQTLREPYVADFSVLSSTELGRLDSKRGILMVVVDPQHTNIVSSESVADLFGLTSAEGDVFSLVVAGRTNKEVADIRGVDPETVASQLKSIFSKTRCNRRGDLVHLAHSVNIPVDAATES